MNFTLEETKKILEDATLSEPCPINIKKYPVNVEKYKDHFEKLGYPKFPIALEFLRKFGGLQISENSKGESQKSYNLKVDPIDLAQGYPPYVFAEFGESLGHHLCPVALADNGHLAVVMDEAGRVYCIDGSVLFHVADNYYKAIQILSHTNWPKFNKVLEID
jgi:hypothetical protein